MYRPQPVLRSTLEGDPFALASSPRVVRGRRAGPAGGGYGGPDAPRGLAPEPSLLSPTRPRPGPAMAPVGVHLTYSRGLEWDKFHTSTALITGEDEPAPESTRPGSILAPGAPMPAAPAAGAAPRPPPGSTHDAFYRDPGVVHQMLSPPRRVPPLMYIVG